jgi:hypothetical protein
MQLERNVLIEKLLKRKNWANKKQSNVDASFCIMQIIVDDNKLASVDGVMERCRRRVVTNVARKLLTRFDFLECAMCHAILVLDASIYHPREWCW